jgi:hypothetical protein
LTSRRGSGWLPPMLKTLRLKAYLFVLALASIAVAGQPPRDPAQTVLAVMLRTQGWSGDKGDTPAARRELYAPVAAVIAEVGSTWEERAILFTLAHQETGLARYVLEGRCGDGPPDAQCDHGLARGPWQVLKWCREAWAAPDGSVESFRAGARCAIKMYRWGGVKCADQYDDLPTASFAGYTANDCHYALASKRAAMLKDVYGHFLKLR